MEIQTTNRNSELAPQEWKPLTNGNVTADIILQARSNQSLRVRHEEEIKQALRYVMVLVGLRANNMPSDEEKFVLLNFIRSNFGNQTPEEIKLAFEWAISGKINVDVKCYENFSCEYFGRIMKAYIEFASQETRHVKIIEEEAKEIPSEEEQKIITINLANMYAQEMIKSQEQGLQLKWKAGGLHSLYLDVVRFGIYETSEEDKQRIYKSLKPKYDNVDELLMACRSQCYREFIENLADFKAYLTETGEIKPCE